MRAIGALSRSGQTPAIEALEDSEMVLVDVGPASASLQALPTAEPRQDPNSASR